MRSTFSKRPEWMRNFFRLEDTQLPTALRNDDIVPVVEVSQGGYGELHDLVTATDDTVGSSGATMLPASSDTGYLIQHAELSNNGATARTVNLRIGHATIGSTILGRSFALGASGGLGRFDIFGDMDSQLWIPPNFRLTTTYSAVLAAGQSVVLTMCLIRVPFGVRPR